MSCCLCGRRLLRAAATVTTADGQGHAGPTCARKAGLLPQIRSVRKTGARRRKVDRLQMEIAA